MTFDVPVLLLTWRRPESTKRVIDAIRCVSPLKMYVASDGPRDKSESFKVQKTRDLVFNLIDWRCDLKTSFSDQNKGCRLGVSEAINWFFNHESEGIILEDDCIPHIDFFFYCQELLKRYQDDRRVWVISGNNFQDGAWRGTASYYFSRYGHCWGWATWRNRWSYYDSNLEAWDKFYESGLMKTVYEDRVERKYWSNIWSNLKTRGVPDSWAYRWAFTCIKNGGLAALPNKNLVLNIGFDDDSTHTKDKSMQVLAQGGLLPVVHPDFFVRDIEADQYSFDHHFGGLILRQEQNLILCLFRKARIKSLLMYKSFLSFCGF